MTTRYAVAPWLYTRALAVTTAIAFISIWTQIDALAGDHGLVPASELLGVLGQRGVGFFDRPTLAWLDASGGFLDGLCALGVLASTFLFFGMLPRTAILVAWLAYLSIVNACMPFMAFQWDMLLLETLFASVLYVGAKRIDGFSFAEEPNRVARWVLVLLLFRLMLRSGIVKLASGDPTWRDLTALTYHYETQPLPTVLGWYAHHLPVWAQKASCAGVFVIELGAPFLALVPHRIPRRIAASAVVALMLVIGATGNYGFFNLLTIVLCIPLVDDDAWRRILPKRAFRLFEHMAKRAKERTLAPWRRRAVDVLAAIMITIGMLGFLGGFSDTDPIELVRPLASFNDYGLFAVMTTSRPEIELEGSADGVEWKPYVFRDKAGPLDRAPTWSQPNMPRLDWQMWFAALGSVHHNPWLMRLMQHLTENDPAILAFFEHNPFPDHPPRYVRATMWDYHFTTLDEHRRTGNFWKRELRGAYAPIVERR